jgi:hypothetical protein
MAETLVGGCNYASPYAGCFDFFRKTIKKLTFDRAMTV